MAVRGKRQKSGEERGRAPAGGGAWLLTAVVCLALGTLLCAASLQSILDSSTSAESLMSSGLWNRTVESLGSRLTPVKDSQGNPAKDSAGKFDVEAQIDFGPVLLLVGLFCVAWWLAGAWWISRRRGVPLAESAARWGTLGGIWWILGGGWELARLAAYLSGLTSLEAVVLLGPPLWISLAAAGWLATFLLLARPAEKAPLPLEEPRDDFRVPLAVWLCYGAYVVVFVAMNWQLYRGLLLPHGDSAMYEEHLWNLLHGKGFRSYLDQGLFLGEHIQVIHLLLLPLYALWPSQMLMELCDSAILAAGCIPVFWMARRHCGNSRVAVWLAAAYLLYFPMQYLDISIELKTFRPNGLAIPILLFALDQLERRRYKSFCGLLLLTLSAQEDYAIVLAPLGVWIALRQWKTIDVAPAPSTKRRLILFGACLAAFSVAYLFVATRLVIPWFRNGHEIHYARYFAKFGNSLPEIGWNMLTKPRLLVDELATPVTAMYLLEILLPVGFLSLFSPGRLAVGVPLLVTLLLNELDGAVDPRHHFHAPLVPIVFWSAAAGLSTVTQLCFDLVCHYRLRAQSQMTTRRDAASPDKIRPPMGGVDAVNELIGIRAAVVGWWSRFACLSAFFTGAFLGLSPLSVAFWDPYSMHYWQKLYIPGKRAELFPRVLAMIPPSARVASTDFVHPRFTHFARSYDYSDYPRAVNNYKPGVPDDTDYIVIDTLRGAAPYQGYGKIERPDQVREYREHPDQWELVPDTTDGYFIVLKRKRPTNVANQPIPNSK
jgi:uncharacterized membrane protein